MSNNVCSTYLCDYCNRLHANNVKKTNSIGSKLKQSLYRNLDKSVFFTSELLDRDILNPLIFLH